MGSVNVSQIVDYEGYNSEYAYATISWDEGSEVTVTITSSNVATWRIRGQGSDTTEYCLGVRHIIRKGVDVIYHCGETIGTNTVIGFIPKQNKKFIFLTNIDNVQGSTFIENLIKLL